MHLHIISKADALRIGLKYYFTGKPCKHGHVSIRRVDGSDCWECTKIRATERQIIHSEKVRSYKAEWHEKNKYKIKQQKRQYREKNKAQIASAKTKYYEKNRDSILEKVRKWYLENQHAAKERTRAWRNSNPDKAKTLDANKKAKRRGAEGKHCRKDIAKLENLQKWKCANCACCIKNGYHVDHIMPIALGGTNWPYNLQLLCPSCNMRKNAKHPLVWAAQNGRLL